MNRCFLFGKKSLFEVSVRGTLVISTEVKSQPFGSVSDGLFIERWESFVRGLTLGLGKPPSFIPDAVPLSG